jgi:hypothetical protein
MKSCKTYSSESLRLMNVLSRVDRIWYSGTGRTQSQKRSSSSRHMHVFTYEERPKWTLKIGQMSVCTTQLTDKQHLGRPIDW